MEDASDFCTATICILFHCPVSKTSRPSTLDMISQPTCETPFCLLLSDKSMLERRTCSIGLTGFYDGFDCCPFIGLSDTITCFSCSFTQVSKTSVR